MTQDLSTVFQAVLLMCLADMLYKHSTHEHTASTSLQVL